MIDLFFFSSRRRHTRLQGDWSSDVCSSDLEEVVVEREPVLRVGQIVFRFGVGLGDEHAARHAPDVGIGTPADLLVSFDIALPVAAYIAPMEELPGDRDPAALAR